MGAPSSVDAVFFDFDGVIVDTVGLKERAFRAIVEPHAGERLDEVMRYYWANGGVSRLTKFRWIWDNILSQPLSDAQLEGLGQKFTQAVYDQVLDCPFVAGAERFLEQFASRWPCYVISGTPHAELQSLVERRGLTRHFRGVFGSPPDKIQIGKRILTEVGFDRRRVWFIGDATTDRDAARHLGVQFVGISGPHLSPFLDGDEITIPDLTTLYNVLGSAV